MASCRVKVHVETERSYESGWSLCLQWCTYNYDNGESEEGYRFIWRRDNNCLQAARGQARIPSLKIAQELIDIAINQGWGNHNAD